MRVRIRCTAGIHGTPWKPIPAHGHVIFERTEFGGRTDLPTDFIVDVESDPKPTDGGSDETESTAAPLDPLAGHA